MCWSDMRGAILKAAKAVVNGVMPWSVILSGLRATVMMRGCKYQSNQFRTELVRCA